MATAAAATTTTKAEPPRSATVGGGAGGSADSYIGSLISLTSKSEIRYEGILYNINTQDSTIGLTNVRSFGTEGRKKDGPQVPPIDKVYEFILFRGSDIKDLQVKSSPPAQTMPSIQSDPAIIQSHYPQAATTPSSLPSSATGSLTDPSSHMPPPGLSRPTLQGSNSLYQPSGGLGSWGTPSLPPPTTSMGGFAMPMYWQGYYGPSNVLQPQQQTLLRPQPPGLSMPPSMPQPMQHPPMNPSPLSASPLLENQPPSVAPFITGSLNLQSSMLPALSSGIVSDTTNLVASKTSNLAPPTTSLSNNLPLASPVISASDTTAIAIASLDKPKVLPEPVVPFKSMPEPLSSISGTSSSIFNGGATPSLVTPGQFLQPGPTTAPSLQSSHTLQKDVEVVQVPSPESPPQPSPPATNTATEVQEPILPLPTPPERKLRLGYNYHGYRGGRERGRGSSISRAATRYTEEFDFTAMNEKFNKDEIWGSLGKSNKAQEDGDDSHDEDNAGASKYDVKPVYVKDDFFDSLSCDALDGGSRNNGRGRHSEQYRRDTETFGEFSRHRGGRGGWGPGRGGRSYGGGYYGRGYGYGGRGRGNAYGYSRSSHGM